MAAPAEDRLPGPNSPSIGRSPTAIRTSTQPIPAPMNKPDPVPDSERATGDTGRFRATHPDLGGFLLEDGTPYQPQTHDQEEDLFAQSSDAPVPYDYTDESSVRGWILTIVITLLVVSVVASVLVSALLISLGNGAVGTAGDLISVLRTVLV